jgi:hypothetical protein
MLTGVLFLVQNIMPGLGLTSVGKVPSVATLSGIAEAMAFKPCVALRRPPAHFSSNAGDSSGEPVASELPGWSETDGSRKLRLGSAITE